MRFSILWDKISDVVERLKQKSDKNHTHTWNEINGKPNNYPTIWSKVKQKPKTFPPDPHTHKWSEVTGKPNKYPNADKLDGHTANDFVQTPSIQSGEASTHISSQSYGTINVTFPKPFNSPPSVVGVPLGNVGTSRFTVYKVKNITTTGCVIQATNVNNTQAVSGTLSINWIATTQ